LPGVTKGEDSFLGNEAQIVEMKMDAEVKAGAGHTSGNPLEHGRATNSDHPGCGGDMIVPLAAENVGFPFIAASDPGWVFEPLGHPRKMAAHIARVNPKAQIDPYFLDNQDEMDLCRWADDGGNNLD
jgi:hypothetical protein